MFIAIKAENNKRDIETINRLAWVAFPATYRKLLSPDQIVFMMDWMYSPANIAEQMRNNHTYFICYWDSKVCGYVSVEKQGEDLFHLQKIYLLPEFQGKGIGKMMFEKAVDFARQSKSTSTCRRELTVNRYNSKALDFYKRMGMRKSSEGDFDIGNGYLMTDYSMALDIN